MMQMIAETVLRPYSKNGVIDITQNANAIQFRNQGNITAIINNVLIIAPGESESINHVDPRVKDGTRWNVSFDVTNNYRLNTTGTIGSYLLVMATFNNCK